MPIRGSSFNNTSNGGPSNVNLNNPRSNVNNNIGFRSASPQLLPVGVTTRGHVQCVWVKGVLFHSKGCRKHWDRRKKIELLQRQLVDPQGLKARTIGVCHV